MSGTRRHGQTRRMVVGITGASGVIYGVRLLELLRGCGVETHLVMSRAVQTTLTYETSLKVAEVEALATATHAVNDIGAARSSGSFRTMGMIVVPRWIEGISEIATGTTNDLISRSVDVVLKELRKVVLLLRETLLHLGHIRTLATATEACAIVCPPVPTFCARPRNLSDLVDHTLGRVSDLFDIEQIMGMLRRWMDEKIWAREVVRATR